MMKKLSYLIKTYPFRSFFSGILVLLIGFIAWNNIYHATKIKDINDPRFDPMAYRFEDYTDNGESQKVLKHIFPVGTPRETVEALLVDKLGSDMRLDTNYRLNNGMYAVHYKIPYNPIFCKGPPWRGLITWPLYIGGRSIEIAFDENNKLSYFINIMVP